MKVVFLIFGVLCIITSFLRENPFQFQTLGWLWIAIYELIGIKEIIKKGR